jgi:hypothetical protein
MITDSKEAWKSLWEPQPFDPLPMLAELREAVLRHNDAKRCPKWAFRLADDLAVQIQPKPVLLAKPGQLQRVLEFQGMAYQDRGGSVPSDIFKMKIIELHRRGNRLGFVLSANADELVWTFKVTLACRPEEVALALRQRVVDLLPGRLISLRPDLMLEPHCLCCGKRLTDPASIARWIGPECWGNGSLTVPGMDRDQLAEKLARRSAAATS